MEKINDGLKASNSTKILGVEVLSVDVLAVRATPEMAKALETETRESFCKKKLTKRFMSDAILLLSKSKN